MEKAPIKGHVIPVPQRPLRQRWTSSFRLRQASFFLDMAEPARVIVTYSAPLLFMSSDQWTQIRTAINAQFPVRNLHWKAASRPSIRTIQELAVDFVAHETLRDEHASQIPTSILERPLLNVYVVTCEVHAILAFISVI